MTRSRKKQVTIKTPTECEKQTKEIHNFYNTVEEKGTTEIDDKNAAGLWYGYSWVTATVLVIDSDQQSHRNQSVFSGSKSTLIS